MQDRLAKVGRLLFGVALALSPIAACLVAPIPDPAQWPPSRPSILHNAVVPRSDQVLTQLPVDGLLLVPVELDDPNESFVARLFVDYAPDDPGSLVSETDVSPSPSTAEGGIQIVALSLDTDNARGRLSAPLCHRIEVDVARTFVEEQLRTPDSVGGDSVVWLYNGAGVAGACPTADGSASDDASDDGAGDGP